MCILFGILLPQLSSFVLSWQVNSVNKSGVFLVEKNFTKMLSGIRRDPSTGRIVAAKALLNCVEFGNHIAQWFRIIK